MKKLLLVLLLITGTALAADNSAAYYIAPPQFNTTIQIMDGGFSTVTALFRNATGSFAFDDTTKSISNIKLAVDTTSLMASSPENQHDLGNMLGAFTNPEMRIIAPDAVTFKDGKADIKANVMLHGAVKPVTFEATLNKTGKAASNGLWGGETEAAGLSLRGQIKRAEFGMVDDPALPGRFGDTIKLLIDVTAIRQ